MAEIRLAHLTKTFGELRAVSDLSLEIPHGSFVALLGPSGCGKTTTMNMISGLERPSSGDVLFDGHSIVHLAPGERNVGFVFQNYAIFTHMTVYDNVAYGLRARRPRPPRERVDNAVRSVARTVGIARLLDRKAGQLSVNDMQKVALARSMIVRPAIFLLDEPFSNLDAAFRGYMRAELKQIQHEVGQTMVYVTHDQVEAMSMADHIAIMHEGTLQQYGPPDEIYNRPANRFVANFVGAVLMNFLPVAISETGDKSGALPAVTEARPIDISDRRDALGSRAASDGLLLAIRPERVEVVGAAAPEATIRARVMLVEPLGARDIIHLDAEGHELRVVLATSRRPRVGESLGLVFPADAIHLFDESSGLVVR